MNAKSAKPTHPTNLRKRTTYRQLKPIISKIIFTLILLFFTALFLVPFLWLISASLKIRSEVFNFEWIPDPVSWINYLKVWQAVPLLTWLKNSVLVGFLAAGAVTISCSLVAFGFSYFRFPGRDFLFSLVLGTMMLPGAVTLIPVYMIWDQLGAVNSITPLWAQNLFGSAFYIFLMRQFFLSLPRELYEAARVDGATYLQMWQKIALPLTRTAMIVVFIFEFKASWAELQKSLIYLQNNMLYTLPRGLKAVLDRFGQGGEMQWEIVLAASVIITVPMVILFFIGQNYFMEGISTTGRKG